MGGCNAQSLDFSAYNDNGRLQVCQKNFELTTSLSYAVKNVYSILQYFLFQQVGKYSELFGTVFSALISAQEVLFSPKE